MVLLDRDYCTASDLLRTTDRGPTYNYSDLLRDTNSDLLKLTVNYRYFELLTRNHLELLSDPHRTVGSTLLRNDDSDQLITVHSDIYNYLTIGTLDPPRIVDSVLFRTAHSEPVRTVVITVRCIAHSDQLRTVHSRLCRTVDTFLIETIC